MACGQATIQPMAVNVYGH